MDFDSQMVFGKKTFSDLLKDIYNNQKKTEQQITDMILTLKPFITSSHDAIMIVPIIKEYMEVKVKNDEHLVKMAGIVQRAMSSSGKNGSDGDYGMSEEELQQLLDTAKELEQAQLNSTAQLAQIESPQKNK